MIAVSLFIIIVMAGMGALLNANLLHQKSRDMRSIIDNLSFVMEDMGRNLRTGYNYRCFINGESINASTVSSSPLTKSCANGWGIAFESQNGDSTIFTDQWVYFIGTYFGKNGIFKSTDGANSFVKLTPDEVVVDLNASGISALGAEPPNSDGSGDHQQPFVTIRLVGTINSKGISTGFSLQTSVSQRLIDTGGH